MASDVSCSAIKNYSPPFFCFHLEFGKFLHSITFILISSYFRHSSQHALLLFINNKYIASHPCLSFSKFCFPKEDILLCFPSLDFSSKMASESLYCLTSSFAYSSSYSDSIQYLTLLQDWP